MGLQWLFSEPPMPRNKTSGHMNDFCISQDGGEQVYNDAQM